jgi:hypothetical protein
MELIADLSEKDENGEPKKTGDLANYILKDEGAFENKLSALVNLEVSVTRLPMSCLQGINITPNILSVLLQTIVNPEA